MKIIKLYDLHSVLDFGKYQGKTIEEILKIDNLYIDECFQSEEWFCITEAVFESLEIVKHLRKSAKLTSKKQVDYLKVLLNFQERKTHLLHTLPKKQIEMNSKYQKINWEFLQKNQVFFNKLFGSYYPFSEAQLMLFKNRIENGFKVIFSNNCMDLKIDFGFACNKNIEWTKTLEEEFKPEFQVKIFPLTLEKKVEELKIEERLQKCGTYQERIDTIEDFEAHMDKQTDVTKKKFKRIEVQKNFSDKELIAAINDDAYLLNEHFYEHWVEKIERDIFNFSIDFFYEEILHKNTNLH